MLAAREVALKKKAADEVRELGDAVQKLGFADPRGGRRSSTGARSSGHDRATPRRSTRDRTVDLACVAIAGSWWRVMAATDAEATGRVTGDAPVLVADAGGRRLRRAVVAAALSGGVALVLAPMAVVTEFVGGAVLVAVYTVAAYRRWGWRARASPGCTRWPACRTRSPGRTRRSACR